MAAHRAGAHAARGVGGRAGALVLLWVLALGLGCSGILGGADDAALVAPAEQALSNGDLPAAAALYQKLYAENPESVAAAVGLAYTYLLAGEIVKADTVLAEIEPKAGEKAGEIRLRRALVALEAKDLDRVKMLVKSSELPEGKLLAAEVHLVDLESDKAVPLLQEVASTGGVVGETATTYLALLQSSDPHKASLAEASALWALGDRPGACDAVKESLKALAEDDPEKDTLLLLWAGRALVSGRVDIAKALMDGAFAPEGQQWRFNATQAMIDLAEGRTQQAIAQLKALQDDAAVPREGIEDALATACALTRDPAVAAQLVEGVESAAAARCLAEVGSEEAAARSPEGPLQTFLENR